MGVPLLMPHAGPSQVVCVATERFVDPVADYSGVQHGRCKKTRIDQSPQLLSEDAVSGVPRPPIRCSIIAESLRTLQRPSTCTTGLHCVPELSEIITIRLYIEHNYQRLLDTVPNAA